MFERFTNSARRVIVLSQSEARALQCPEIMATHLLLGIMRQPEEPVTTIIESHSIDVDAIRERVREAFTVDDLDPETREHIPFSPAAKQALELSLRKSLRLGVDHIGPEHLALGVLSGDESDAVRILADLGVDVAKLNRDIESPPQSG
jgi:ATP-dependent Clp protease ATP-binding subunit ClpC